MQKKWPIERGFQRVSLSIKIPKNNWLKNFWLTKVVILWYSQAIFEVDEIMKNVPKGKLTTINEIRAKAAGGKI
jgi:hypothetical protein